MMGMRRRLVSAMWGAYYPFDMINGVNEKTDVVDPKELRQGDILVTWGGGDIHPSLYKQPQSKHSGAGLMPSNRDECEWALMHRAVVLGVPIIGVCRGAQMLCALAGGRLLQHVGMHHSRHEVMTDDHQLFHVNSIHHQMMYPFDVEHELIAWTPRPLSDKHIDVDEPIDIPVEPEFVYFPQVKGFAIQWHPEMLHRDEPATHYVVKRINTMLEVEQKVNQNDA